MHRWRRSGALGFGAAYDGRFGFDDTENLGGVGARLPTLTLAKVAAPNSVGDARIAADALKLGLHLKHDVPGVLPGGAAPGGGGGGGAASLAAGAAGWLGDDLSRGRAGTCVLGGLACGVGRRAAGFQLDVARQGVIGSDGRKAEGDDGVANAIVHRDMGESPLARHGQ